MEPVRTSVDQRVERLPAPPRRSRWLRILIAAGAVGAVVLLATGNADVLLIGVNVVLAISVLCAIPLGIWSGMQNGKFWT